MVCQLKYTGTAFAQLGHQKITTKSSNISVIGVILQQVCASAGYDNHITSIMWLVIIVGHNFRDVNMEQSGHTETDKIGILTHKTEEP